MFVPVFSGARLFAPRMLSELTPAWKQITQPPVRTYGPDSLPLFLAKRALSNLFSKLGAIMVVAHVCDNEFSRRQTREVFFGELFCA
jgi:hypothetical protein